MAKKPENLSFEDSLSELETLVAELEKGELSLEDALKHFERGVNLVQTSQTKLEQAQQKVSVLVNKDGSEQLVPFADEDN
ncbi:MAG: exodeoxyribonuclease VII small subunit [Parashewanella sp.]